MDTFLGKPVSLWMDLDMELKTKGIDELLMEITKLRGQVSL